MDRVLTQFIRALRNAEVRISTAETLDAIHAVRLIGYGDRALLKNSLSLTLSKTQSEKTAFDTTFERFFSSRTAPSDTQHPADADDADTEPTAELPPSSSSLGQLLMTGSSLDMETQMSRAGEQVGVRNIQSFMQKGLFTHRVLDALGQQALQQEIRSLAIQETPQHRQLADKLRRRREQLRARVRDFVEQQFLLHADVTGRRLRESLLRNVRLGAVDQSRHRHLQDIVRRMAQKLVSAYSKRRRITRRGQLHVPRTLRRNMRYDDAIFDLRWKSDRLDRPKVFAICDVSGSVANYNAFMLMFLYSLEALLPKVRSFAFSSRLAEVTDLFSGHPLQEAIALTLHEHGGSTDYGRALTDFRERCLSKLDHRSTVIIMGDARNNHGDPRADILKEIYDRCHRVLWLNPEARSLWNTGDSVMRKLSPYCHAVEECGTLQQLERAIGRLLRAT